MNTIQALMDGMSANWQKERGESDQMTLGQVIARLSELPQNLMVSRLGGLDSYRGYYCDLSFSTPENPRPVSEILQECKAAMGKVFTGYKGGDFMMGESTPVWIAEYGSCGDKLIGIRDDGALDTVSDDD